MRRDKGVNPGYVERAFRSSDSETLKARSGMEHMHAARVARQTKIGELRRDLDALAELQAARPMTPPSRRK